MRGPEICCRGRCLAEILVTLEGRQAQASPVLIHFIQSVCSSEANRLAEQQDGEH